MNRRALLLCGMGATAGVLAPARTRSRRFGAGHLWLIYRRYSLLIVGQRDDEIASTFAGAVVDVLARFTAQLRVLG